MPKRPEASSPVRPEFCFVKELPGEIPPPLSALEGLYKSAIDMLGVQPWEFLEDGNPIVVRDSISGELCYCSVMGALGEVFAMHAYIGPESLRLYRRIATQQILEPGEFFQAQRSVSVEFVPRGELEKQDRELLNWLGHPDSPRVPCPMFRAMRPGFHPWFINAEEAQTLDECIRATLAVCHVVTGKGRKRFWTRADHYPLVTLAAEGEPQIEVIKATPPEEPPLPPARLDEFAARQLKDHDFPIRGILELDYIPTAAPIGKKNERKACTCIGIAVDAGERIAVFARCG